MDTIKTICVLFLVIVTTSINGQINLTAADTTSINFQVEFASSRTPLNLSDVKYKDLPDVTYYKDKASGVFRYNSGNFKNLDAATSHRDILFGQGLHDAQVVAFKNQRQINLSDVAKYKIN
jgi:hypothetical protein